MTEDIAAQIRQTGWGAKGQILTEHLIQLIQTRVWPPGEKVPSSRKIALEYGVSLETVRSAMRELQGRDLIKIKPRSGAVVCEKPSRVSHPSKHKHIAYVRLLDLSLLQPGASIQGDTILAGLERDLLQNDLQVMLVSERHDTSTRAEKLIGKLRDLMPTLVGVIMLRPPKDVHEGVTRALDELGLPWLVVGQGSGQARNCISPDFLHMGQIIGRYLSACQARQILFLTRRLSRQEHYSGIEKMEGLVGGYLQTGQPSPIITPLICEEVDDQTSYANTLQYLQQGHRPDAIIGYGDRMSLGAVVACREMGLRVPDDISILGTTGVAAAAYFDPPVTVADQQLSLLATTATAKLMEMIKSQSRDFVPMVTPVKLVIRKSSRMSPAIAEALAPDIQAGHVVIEP